MPCALGKQELDCLLAADTFLSSTPLMSDVSGLSPISRFRLMGLIGLAGNTWILTHYMKISAIVLYGCQFQEKRFELNCA